MKNINNYILNSGYIIAVLTVLITVSSCNTWDDHYEQLDTRLESDIITVLSEDDDYSTFLTLLEQTEYKEFLKTSQAYTVWAPNNDALSQVSDEILNNPASLKQLIENHISRNSYVSSNLTDDVLVKMYNDKYIEFTNEGGVTTFGGVDLIEKDVLTSNGILHKIGSVLSVKPNIWSYLNDNADDFPTLMEYFNQFKDTIFDEENSVRTGRNSLGQFVYDSIFKISNKNFEIIGDISSEEERYTFIGLTDAVYSDVFDNLKDYYQYPVEDSIKSVTDKVIFNNLNFPFVKSDELNGEAISTTTGNSVIINPASIASEQELSNGNLFIMNQYDLDPNTFIHQPIRYEIEDTERRTLGSLTDFTVASRYNRNASGQFTNVVTLLERKDIFNRNNYFEIAFENVLSASYSLRLKFTPIGASKQTKLKFEVRYVDADKKVVLDRIDAITVSNLEDGLIDIGGTYDIPVYINEENDNEYFVKLRVIVDVSEAETILYDKSFGIDYAELVPVY